MGQLTRPSLLFTLILLAAVPLLSLNMFLPSLGVMATDFQVGYDEMAFAVSGYLAFTALIQILTGPLADRLGRRPVLLVSLGVFTCASVGCALAQDYTTFLFFRVLQGAIATGAALSRAVVNDLVPPNQTASMLAYIAMAMSIAPIIGPALGGLIGDAVGWRSNFWLYTGAGLGLWVLVWAQLPETAELGKRTLTDFAKTYLELLQSRYFWSYTIIMALAIGAFFVFVSGLPLVAGKQLGMTQAQIGLGIGSITFGFLVGSFISGRFSAFYKLDTMILLGRILASLGLLCCLLLLWSEWLNPVIIFGGTIFVGIGNGLSTPSASAAVMQVRKELSGSASGLSGAVIVLSGGVFSAFTGVAMSAQPTALTLVSIMFVLTLTSLLIAILIRYWAPEIE
ncbi:multidrug effflux MFS transporter [Paracoccaceae bacterium]|jgi:DHA1 family bicyclomycin/chloramphenicol resistance-like MFS transporter|nr:multidrug effflux MFS transporter [Paracoccaceae bacterium]|tara:strand:+ start:469 stop:1656 length:1188 start_codon:yes stop_codon:yes gene_type:complete